MKLQLAKLTKTINKLDLVFKLVWRLVAIILVLVLIIPGSYLVICFVESLKAPAKFYITVEPTQTYPGGMITINFLDMYRSKVCGIHRTITVTTKNDSRVYEYQQADVKISGTGKIPPFTTKIKLSYETVSGPAKLNLHVQYRCPNNIIQKYYPTVRNYSTEFTVLDTQPESLNPQ